MRLFCLVVSWFGLGLESIVDSYGWVENHSSTISLVDMTLFVDKYSWWCSYEMLFYCANALN
jgi:hypothetical protein